MCNRNQIVVLAGCKPAKAEALSGVLQGTVPGPLHFLGFINDLPEYAKHTNTHLFTDDSALYRKIKGQKGYNRTSMHWKNERGHGK